MAAVEGIAGWRRKRLEKSHALGAPKFVLYYGVLPFGVSFTILTIIIFLTKGSVISPSATAWFVVLIALISAAFGAVFGWLIWLNVDASYEQIFGSNLSPSPVPPTVGPKTARSLQTWLVVISGSLIVKFLFALMPVTEAPSSALKTLTIVTELTMTVSVIGLGIQVLRSPGSSRLLWGSVMTTGALAGVGLFVIRASGGPPVQLPPRPEAATRPEVKKDLDDLITSTKPLFDQLNSAKQALAVVGLRGHVLRQIDQFRDSWALLQQTNWMKTSPDDRQRKITREDLRNYDSRLSEVHASIEQLLEGLGSVTDSGLSTLVASEKGYWQLSRDSCALSRRQAKVFLDNWKEWHLNGLQSKSAEPKAWEKEILQLQDQIDDLSKKQLSAPTKLFE